MFYFAGSSSYWNILLVSAFTISQKSGNLVVGGLCTAAPYLKKNFFEVRGGCTQAKSLESGIPLTTGVPNPSPWNPWHGIQNPSLSWILLPGAIIYILGLTRKYYPLLSPYENELIRSKFS